MRGIALIAGASGIIGNNLARHLIEQGWTVYGLARHPPADIPELQPVAADLLRPDRLRDALAGVQLRQLQHARHDPRLRDGLSFGGRQCVNSRTLAAVYGRRPWTSKPNGAHGALRQRQVEPFQPLTRDARQ